MSVRMLMTGGASVLAFTAVPVGAQESAAEPGSPRTEQIQGLDEIIVTATRTGETAAQRTPVAISVLSGDKLNSSLAVNVKDLVQLTPNLNVSQTTASAQIYIRGIGSNNVFAGSDPDVTVQSDGVYIARAFGQFTDFVDIQRIEVLRGPQGTLYGRNAVGGTINIISKLPSDEVHARVQLAAGNYGTLQQQSYLSGPLVAGKVQASIASNYIRHTDYDKNVVPGRHGSNNANRGGVRGQLRFRPSGAVDMITRADYNRGREHVQTFEHTLAPIPYAPLATSLIGNYHRIALDQAPRSDTKLWGISHEVNVSLSKAVSLKSLTAFRRSQYDLVVDQDGTEIPGGISRQAEVSKQFSQEFNANLNIDRLDAVAGIFYFHDRDTTDLVSFIPPSPRTVAARSAQTVFAPISIARSVAAFVQGTFRPIEKLGFTAGIRYTRDRRTIEQTVTRSSLNPATFGSDFPGFPFVARQARTYDAFTPKFGVDYQMAPDILIFGSATRGFKSGGTNFTGTNPLALSFGPESIWSYEAGVKSEFFDKRLRVNISAFRYDYNNLQVQALIGAGLASITNAASARNKGFEIEATAKPVPNLLLTASYALLDARYRKFPLATVPNPLIPFLVGDPLYTAATNTFNAAGKRLNAAPHSSFSLSGRYDVEAGTGKAFVRGEFYHQSRAFYDPSNALIASQSAYGVVNAAIGWNSDDGKWGAQIVGKNLAQKDYLIQVAANGIVPAGVSGAPRTLTLQVTRNW